MERMPKGIYQVAQKRRDAFGYSLLAMRKFLPHSLCRSSKPDLSRFLANLRFAHRLSAISGRISPYVADNRQPNSVAIRVRL